MFACMLIIMLVLAMCSWVDVDPSEEPQYQYPEQPSSEQFEQQEQYEEGKYNMNILSPLITISFCILILYAYKDIPSHFVSFIYTLGCILVSCARLLRYNIFWSFLIKLINGLLEFNSESGTLCGLSGSLLVKIGFVRNMV